MRVERQGREEESIYSIRPVFKTITFEKSKNLIEEALFYKVCNDYTIPKTYQSIITLEIDYLRKVLNHSGSTAFMS